jgi:spermidine/putrescine transport system substrate-binding protein
MTKVPSAGFSPGLGASLGTSIAEAATSIEFCSPDHVELSPMPNRLSSSPRFRLGRRAFLGRSLAATAAGATPCLAFGQDKQVNIYNWDTYIGESTLDDFTRITRVAVRYDLFASNEELFAKLLDDKHGYDVIFPSSNYVERLIAAKMIEPLDHAKLSNITNLAQRFQNPAYDPGLVHSVPYFWGTQGVGYRKSAADPAPTKWADLLASDRFKGRIALLNDTDIVRAALKFLGYSLDTNDKTQIDKAADALVEAKPNIKAFAPDTGQDLLSSGEVDLCMEWSGDIQQVIAEDNDLAYIVPQEGALLWVDAMCIPKGAPHRDNAHAFINFILDPQVHGQIASEIRFACPNRAAIEHIPEADRANPAIYPSDATLERCEFATYKGEEVEGFYEAALNRVLAA